MRPSDVDVVLLTGYRFPRYHGGPLKWAVIQGLPGVFDDIKSCVQNDSYFWGRTALLDEIVDQGRSYDDMNKELLS